MRRKKNLNKNKILSIFTLFVMIGSISFADNNLKTIENQEIVLSSEVDQYKNTVKNEIISDGIKYKLKNMTFLYIIIYFGYII